MACLRICDFYKVVIIFCQTVRVKNKQINKSNTILAEKAELRNYKTPFFKTKTPFIPPATRCCTIPKYLHFPSSLHDKGTLSISKALSLSLSLSRYVPFCIPSFRFSTQSRWNHVIGVKRGVKHRKKLVSVPPGTEEVVLHQGRAHAPAGCGQL